MGRYPRALIAGFVEIRFEHDARLMRSETRVIIGLKLFLGPADMVPLISVRAARKKDCPCDEC